MQEEEYKVPGPFETFIRRSWRQLKERVKASFTGKGEKEEKLIGGLVFGGIVRVKIKNLG